MASIPPHSSGIGSFATHYLSQPHAIAMVTLLLSFYFRSMVQYMAARHSAELIIPIYISFAMTVYHSFIFLLLGLVAQRQL